MSKIKDVKPFIGMLTHFALSAYFEYLFVHKWLGYPIIPGTTTNDYWGLIQINLEMLFLTVVFFIPSILLATLVVGGLWFTVLTVQALPYVYAILKEGENDA